MGTCKGFVCTQCPVTSTSDNSACVTCDDSTLGVSGNGNSPYFGDCECDALTPRLVENDNVKSCSVCPSNQGIVLFDQFVAGVQFRKDLYNCQSCPDVNMDFIESTGGAFVCQCRSGYTQIGQSSIGPQSCVDSISFI